MTSQLITPSELKIDLYKEGFGERGLPGRKHLGLKLSNLVEDMQQPMVIAVDSSWGAGKSTFLKFWVGSHSIENQKSGVTLYYDAFKYDFLDDPLVGLANAVADRLEQNGQSPQRIKRLKEMGARLGKSVLRVGLAAASGGLTEIAGPLIDPIVETTSDEVKKAVENFWHQE